MLWRVLSQSGKFWPKTSAWLRLRRQKPSVSELWQDCDLSIRGLSVDRECRSICAVLPGSPLPGPLPWTGGASPRPSYLIKGT